MAEKVVDYKIVFGLEDYELEEKVRANLKDGFELYGMPFIDARIFYQVMIKLEKV